MTEPAVARWWSPAPDAAVQCRLCPRQCRIPEGACGFCGVRKNAGGQLRTLSYGHPIALAIDPIEKKPIAHFLPRTRTFSFGTYGCNLGCLFCQNASLSRGVYSVEEIAEFTAPEEIVELALRHRCPSISYTYNEPTIFAEYLCDIARLARRAGLKNILVSNGYIAEEAANEIYPLLDAANIDMKGFSEEFYRSLCAGSLAPVLRSLEHLRCLGVHLEVTTLVIPGKNDRLDEIGAWLDWAELHLGRETPLHFSAYHPAYRCAIPPTPPETLYAIRDLAARRGFPNIHLGNLPL